MTVKGNVLELVFARRDFFYDKTRRNWSLFAKICGITGRHFWQTE